MVPLQRSHHVDGLPRRDPDTGVPNRELLLTMLEPIVALARRNARGLAILHLRVDGELRADEEGGRPAPAAWQVAHAIRDLIRDCDILARVGEHAFALALSEVWEPDAAVRVAHRLHGGLRSGSLGSGSDERSGPEPRIGVAFFPPDGEDAAALLAAAEAATPAPGAEAIGFANGPLGHDALRRAGLRRDLEGSAVLSQFDLHYQPIRDIATGAVVGAESLLRWNRSGALLPAADFIDIAESSGRIRALDLWSVERALRDLHAWRARGWNGWMAINLSGRSLANPALREGVERLLARSEVPPEAVVFEVTERAALTGDGLAVRLLEELRGLGTRIAVDDFGAGYASFEYLCHFDPDIVKLDRAFVAGGKGSDRLLGALVDVAHRLGKPVIAEGVEAPRELKRSADCTCEMAQGYFLGRPVPAAAFVATHIEAQRTA